jgi:hypothetical protein
MECDTSHQKLKEKTLQIESLRLRKHSLLATKTAMVAGATFAVWHLVSAGVYGLLRQRLGNPDDLPGSLPFLVHFAQSFILVIGALLTGFFYYAWFLRKTRNTDMRFLWRIGAMSLLLTAVMSLCTITPEVFAAVISFGNVPGLRLLQIPMPLVLFLLITRVCLFPLCSLAGGTIARFLLVQRAAVRTSMRLPISEKVNMSRAA